MSFEEALQLQLKQLDDAYQGIRAYHADLLALNDSSSRNKELQARFDSVSQRIFRLKLAWSEASAALKQ